MKPDRLLLTLLEAIAKDLEYAAMQVFNETNESGLALRLQADSEAIQQIHDWIS